MSQPNPNLYGNNINYMSNLSYPSTDNQGFYQGKIFDLGNGYRHQLGPSAAPAPVAVVPSQRVPPGPVSPLSPTITNASQRYPSTIPSNMADRRIIPGRSKTPGPGSSSSSSAARISATALSYFHHHRHPQISSPHGHPSSSSSHHPPPSANAQGHPHQHPHPPHPHQMAAGGAGGSALASNNVGKSGGTVPHLPVRPQSTAPYAHHVISNYYGTYQGVLVQPEDPSKPPKVLQCDGCELRFARKHDLNRHRRIHNGEAPYLCGGCNKSFKRSDARKRHWDTDKDCYKRNLESENIL